MARWSCCSTLVFLLLLAAATTAQSAGNEVVGFYRVEQVTDLGPQVRVSLHIRLVNNSPQELSITKVALHDLHQGGRPVEAAAWARLRPREGTTLEQEFVVSRAEYKSWSKGAGPALQVTFQPAEGREMMRTIALQPSRVRRPQ